jgi:hypothetical protein
MSNQGTVYQLDPTNNIADPTCRDIWRCNGSILTIGSQSNTGNMSGFSSNQCLYILAGLLKVLAILQNFGGMLQLCLI